MKKFIPSIVIWNLEMADKEGICQNLYFLSRKRANKFWRKHEAELKEYGVCLGGVQLWLW